MKQSPAFTTVELIVAISIVAIFPLVVIANFQQIKLQFSLTRVAHRFAQDVRSAQDKAVSSPQYTDAFGTQRLVSGYGVHVDVPGLGNRRYVVYANQDAANQQFDGLDYTFQNVDLSQSDEGIVIKEVINTFANQASVSFRPPHPDVIIIGLMPDQRHIEVVFALQNDLAKIRRVLIYTSGLIEVK